MAAADKDPEAFRTIGELSEELGVAQHILRYWETKFPQLRPLQRAGNRRYYRPADVALARRIHHLLSNQGYTVREILTCGGKADNSRDGMAADRMTNTPRSPCLRIRRPNAWASRAFTTRSSWALPP